MLCVFFASPIRVMSLSCVVTDEMYITQTIVVKFQWGSVICSSKTAFSYFLKNDSFCIHLLNSSHVVCSLSFLTIHLLTALPGEGV